MSARMKMTMRAKVERNTATGDDDFGHPVKPAFTTHGTFPCWAWSRADRRVIDGDKTALVEDFRAMFPRGSDVVAGDQIAQIEDRRGTVLMSGRFQIEAVQFKRGHLETGLEVVS